MNKQTKVASAIAWTGNASVTYSIITSAATRNGTINREVKD